MCMQAHTENRCVYVCMCDLHYSFLPMMPEIQTNFLTFPLRVKKQNVVYCQIPPLLLLLGLFLGQGDVYYRKVQLRGKWIPSCYDFNFTSGILTPQIDWKGRLRQIKHTFVLFNYNYIWQKVMKKKDRIWNDISLIGSVKLTRLNLNVQPVKQLSRWIYNLEIYIS